VTCGRSITGIAGSTPAEGMDVRLLCSLCVVQVAASATVCSLVQRSSVGFMCVCLGYQETSTMRRPRAPVGLLRHRNKNPFRGPPRLLSNGYREIFFDGKVACAWIWLLTSIERPTLQCVEPPLQVCKGDDHARAPFFEYYWAVIRADWNGYRCLEWCLLTDSMEQSPSWEANWFCS